MIQAASQGKAGVYAIVNTVNGKRYVGSSVNLKKRLQRHEYEMRKGIHDSVKLSRSVEKYGLENFEFIILEHCNTKIIREIRRREKYWIDIYDFSRLYNIIKDPVEHRMKTPYKVYMYSATENVLIKVFDTVVEAAEYHDVDVRTIYAALYRITSDFHPTCCGFRWSKEPLFSLKNTYQKINNAKRIDQFDTLGQLIKTWESAREVERVLGFKHKLISSCLRGSAKTSYGYIWKYHNLKDHETVGKIVNLSSNIRQIDVISGFTVKVWDSANQINKEFGYDTSFILRVCKNNLGTAYGYQWKFEESE